jgi:DNA-binding NtrC family response regulator
VHTVSDETRQLTDLLAGADVGLELLVLDGSQAGTRVALSANRPLIVGQSDEATVALDDSSVSRLHLELRVDGPRVRAIDLKSTNGSYLGGHRFEAAELSPGAVIRVGETHLQLLTEGAQEPLPPSNATAFGGLRGKSHAMRMAFAVLERAARTDTTVLITGETGTGKEVTADAIHRESRRGDGPFIVIDCASIPANLVESELFGHVKGAFTHASSDRAGAFRSANGGTIFLDEIGELPPDLQSRLLRVLETQTVKPVGSNTYEKVDVRVVAATNRDLEEEVRQRRFRSDLFFRLAVIRVHLPPLRQRPEDIPFLARHFAQEAAGDAERIALSPTAVAALMAHDWPGNVRELRNTIQQASALSPKQLSLAQALHPEGEPIPAANSFDAFFDMPFREARKAAQAAFERAYVQHAVEEAGGNVTKAAQKAGLHRNMVHRILAREPDED